MVKCASRSLDVIGYALNTLFDLWPVPLTIFSTRRFCNLAFGVSSFDSVVAGDFPQAVERV
jgi:hypothetical protein